MSRRLLLTVAVLTAVAAGAWVAWARYVDRIVEVPVDARSTPLGEVHFGGPDQPNGRLRSLLLQHARAAPGGSAIDWATYLFVDAEIADALIAASDRGVRVTLCIDGNPRARGVNDPVIARLQRHGLNGGLTVRRHGSLPPRLIGALHSKIYAFSHPRPMALIGSIDPAGGAAVNTPALQDVGDQYRGHNLLVEVTSAGLVATLREHVRTLAASGGSISPFPASQNATYRDRDTQLFFYPRLRPGIVDADLSRLGRGDRVSGAISHLGNVSLGVWTAAAKRGATISLIVHESERRVPRRVVDRLAAAGIEVRRYRDPGGLPMHAKFLLIERAGERVSYFGSFNFNLASRRFNHEVLVRSTDARVFAALLRRFGQLHAEVRQQDRQASER